MSNTLRAIAEEFSIFRPKRAWSGGIASGGGCWIDPNMRTTLGVFGAHGQFCASHPWEVIVATLTLVACAWSVEKAAFSGDEVKCAGWAHACPGLEAEYAAADAVLMTAVRCIALLYAYYQFSNLHKLASKYLIAIAGVFSTFASFVFTSALVNVFWSDVANLKDAPFLFLLAADVSRGARLARAGGVGRGGRRAGLARALAALGPAATLDTLLSALLVGVGSLSAVPRLERVCKFACMALMVDYLVFLTFYPACLSLVMELSTARKDSSSKSLDGESEQRTNPVVQRVKMIMAAGLLCVHLRSRWSWKEETPDQHNGILSSPNRSMNNPQDELLHPYVKFFSVSADHIVILTLLCALAVKFIFFEEREDLEEDEMNELQSRFEESTSLMQKRPVFTISDLDDKEDKETQTQLLEDRLKEDELVHIDSSSTLALSKKIRSLPECLEIYRSEAGAAALSDDEVLMLVEQSHIPLYRLESALGDALRGVKLRRRAVAQTFELGKSLDGLPYLNYDYSKVLNACCENVIGYVGVPVGFAGPLIVDGRAYMVPMATTEGALVASANRGAKAIGSRGVVSVVDDVGMTRAPALRFCNVVRAHEARQWIENKENFVLIKEAFDGTSRFAKLQDIHVGTDGPTLYVRFRATTGDAMGMNMVSKGAEQALQLIHKYFPDMEVISLSGNYCSDKKAAAINWIKGRGKRVVCEATVSGETLRKIFKTDAKTLARCNKLKNLTGSALAGSIGGNNAHAANMVTAIFIATGQDPAQNVTSSYCSTNMESINDDQDLYITCTMPSLEVGTIGGGTVLEGQAACLTALGVRGSGSKPAEHAARLASIVCAAVLAAELSLMAALVNADLVRSHMRHNRSAANIQLSAASENQNLNQSNSSKTTLGVPSNTS